MIEPKPTPIFDRELSWLEFNSRVLAEGMNPSVPLLEQLKFVGIVSSNLDEFFMVRIPAAKNQPSASREIYQKAFDLTERQNQYFLQTLVPALEAQGIKRIAPQTLTHEQLGFVRNLFDKEMFSVLTPVAISEDRPLPNLSNLSLYLILLIKKLGDPVARFSVVEIPKNFSRMIGLPAESGFSFVLLEDVIALFTKELFRGCEILEKGLMRITREAEMSLNEEKDEDFAHVMAEALRQQHRNNVVRIEILGSKTMTDFFVRKLEVPSEAVYEVKGWFDLKTISQLAFHTGFEHLKDSPWPPVAVPDFENADDLWELLRKKDVLVIHPYDSFDGVKRFVAEAAEDPDVLAVKQTLYRASGDSSVVASLIKAAENGKRVTVLVELKARFDEEKNIQWARQLEDAGATVLYGVAGFKTHAKACLVIRREADGIRRYLHLSTGNYNEKTAQIYSDIGLFTSNESMANDVSALFNMITGYSEPIAFSKLVVAPYALRRTLKRLIHREILRSKEKPGLIIAKLNSLVDPDIIQSLYQASRAGVRIQLNVRGICCLVPGISGLSENIEVVSLIDRFLEHSRMVYFANGGEEEFYLSSADWMPRNFDRRIEVMFPVEDTFLKKDLIQLLHFYFKDNVKSWRLMPDGTYEKLMPPEGTPAFRTQEFLYQRAAAREKLLRANPPTQLKPQRPRHSSVKTSS